MLLHGADAYFVGEDVVVVVGSVIGSSGTEQLSVEVLEVVLLQDGVEVFTGIGRC
jgi:ribosomal protein L18E